MATTRIGSLQSRGLSTLNAGLGNPKLTWNGTDLECVPHQSDTTRKLEEGGLAPEVSISFVVKRALFSDTIPQARQFVTYLGSRRQIDRVKVSSCGSHIVLDCLDPDRGARVS